jgi:regulator of RNase E activity RraA
MKEIPEEILTRLRAIAPATIGHLIYTGFMDTAIRPLSGSARVRVVGRAVTLRGPGGHVAIDQCQPGDVLVIDNGGQTQRACWGEMTALATKQRGASAVIIDGAVTDVAEILEMGLPTYARAISALLTGPKRDPEPDAELNFEIQCGGVTVHAGDAILADENGIVVIPPEKVEELLALSEPRQAREPYTRSEILKGRPLSEISGAKDRTRVVEVE